MNGNVAEDGCSWKAVNKNFATAAIHAGYKPKEFTFAPVIPSITLSTTFVQDEPAKHRGYDYTRSGNPMREILEKTLAALDKGKYATCYSSGLAATSTIVQLLKTGDHMVCIDDVYGGTGRLFRQLAKTNGLFVDFLDFADANQLKAALKPNTKVIWVETPTNPTLKLVDIAKVSELAHAFNKDIIVAVDNTFLTPYYQLPLELGADLVTYSLTKYMNGHSDVLMGAIITNSEELNTRLAFLQYAIGAVPSPFDCFLVNRSLKTLHVRMPLHMKNALAVAKFLEGHPKVSKVLHPGLPSHPQHTLALKQSSGHSGLISFYIKEGAGNPVKFLQELKIFSLAESLGGYESLSEIPATMTHASVPVELRQKLGITDNFIRLSVGLESEEDLLNDLDQALKNC